MYHIGSQGERFREQPAEGSLGAPHRKKAVFQGDFLHWQKGSRVGCGGVSSVNAIRDTGYPMCAAGKPAVA